ncbi:hypothetical protein C4571_03340 [Candidatus Parcubacteria bacterium]|nr:MAG: hypothetical protein C4571_03340 [Candidatus Parcubacteria bacterium]
MPIYRFSPIESKEKLIEAVRYVVEKTSTLSEKIVGKSFPITHLTIFAHSQDEYENLVEIQDKLGKFYNENNGPRVTLHEPITIGKDHITHLRIRKPDPERSQVGCSDFETDYESFKRQYLSSHPNNLRLIERPAYEMIEFFDPAFDVLAYVVSKPI